MPHDHEHVHELLWSDYLDLLTLLAPSLLTALALGLAGAVLGLFVLLRRQSLLALALPNVVAVGAAIGLRWGAMLLPVAMEDAAQYIGWPTLPPAVLCVAVALVC